MSVDVWMKVCVSAGVSVGVWMKVRVGGCDEGACVGGRVDEGAYVGGCVGGWVDPCSNWRITIFLPLLARFRDIL